MEDSVTDNAVANSGSEIQLEQVSEPETAVSAATAEAIGRFVVAWGTLEHELEGIITAMFRIAPVFRSCLTTELTIRPKVEMIRSGLGIGRGLLVDEARAEEFNKALNEVLALTSEYRNFVFHWIVARDAEGVGLTGAKLKFGKVPKMVMLRVNAAYFAEATNKVGAVRAQLRTMREYVAERYIEQSKWHIEEASDDQLWAELRRRGLLSHNPDIAKQD